MRGKLSSYERRKVRCRKAAANPNTDAMLTTYQVADLLGISYYTVTTWRRRGLGPPYIRFSRTVLRYPRASFDRFLRQHLQNVGKKREAHNAGLQIK
jgi:hypothetical protein